MQKVSLLPLVYKLARIYLRSEAAMQDENRAKLEEALRRLMTYLSRNQVPQSYLGLGRAAADTLYSFALTDLLARSSLDSPEKREELRHLAVIRFMFAFQQCVGPLTTNRWRRRK
jgi:hypothetical protein